MKNQKNNKWGLKGEKMFNKKIIVGGLLLLFVLVAFNPMDAANYKGYTTDVNGFTFNMIEGYEPDYEMVLDEDTTNIYGEQIHLYILSYYGDDGVISISTMTRYSEPFTEAGTDYEGTIKIIRMWTHYDGMR